MPNWVHNNLTITGDAEQVRAVKDRLSARYERKFMKFDKSGPITEVKVVEQDFSFWNIVRPEGEALVRYEESLGGGGATPYWYDWNVNNWGTKWDADAELTEHAADHLQYQFDTAWSPPIEAMKALGSLFPEVHVELDWEEEQGFGGTMTFTGGAVEVTDEYDIPTSHAEMFDRKGYCHCEGYDEKWFADCPVEEVDETMIIPENEIDVEALV